MPKAPPGPRDGGIGFLRSASSGGLVRYLDATARRYGPVSSFRAGMQRIVLVDDAQLIERILVTWQREFVRDTGAALVRELVGEGLLTTDDPAHLARRRLMQPAFHRARVARYSATIVTETERVAAGWNGAPFDVGAAMARLTLGAVAAALFGADLRDEARRVAAILARVLERGASLGALLAFAAPRLDTLHRLFPKRDSILFPRERAELRAIVEPIVTARRRSPETAGDDLLALLLEARDEAGGTLDDVGLTNELVMLILAGHETTANALTWTWYLLANHPAVERRLHDELDVVLGGRTPTFDDVPKLRFTAAIFDEALRLYPPAAAFARRPLHPIELGGLRDCEDDERLRESVRDATKPTVLRGTARVRTGAMGRPATREVRLFSVRRRQQDVHRRAVRTARGRARNSRRSPDVSRYGVRTANRSPRPRKP